MINCCVYKIYIKKDEYDFTRKLFVIVSYCYSLLFVKLLLEIG